MRIIITKNGKHILKEIENEKTINSAYNNQNNATHTFHIFRNFSCIKLPRINKNYSTLKSFYETHKNMRWGRSPCGKPGLARKTMDNYFNRDESKISKRELNMAKKIKLTKNKINISQQFLDKYDDLDSTYKDKINKLTNTLKSKTDKGKEEKMKNEIMKNNMAFNTINVNSDINNNQLSPFSNNDNKKNKIVLGDIISVKNLISMRKMLSKDNTGPDDTRVPLNDQNKDSFNFRSKYENKKLTYENLNILLNLPMNPDRKNLIEYYRQNKSIAPFYFENLLKYNEAQIYKLNKICQIIFHKQEDEKKEAKIIKDKKFNREKLIRQKGNSNMKYVNELINKSNGIINGYVLKQESNNIKRKKIYIEEVKKIKKKYWDKYGVNKFYKEGQVLSQNYLSTTDFEELQAKELKKKNNFAYSKSTPDLLNK
jgi:hypothetical protein